MLESQNPGFRVLNLKTRVPKFMRKPGFSGSGSNPGSIPTSDNLFSSNLSPILEFTVKFESQTCHEIPQPETVMVTASDGTRVGTGTGKPGFFIK